MTRLRACLVSTAPLRAQGQAQQRRRLPGSPLCRYRAAAHLAPPLVRQHGKVVGREGGVGAQEAEELGGFHIKLHAHLQLCGFTQMQREEG